MSFFTNLSPLLVNLLSRRKFLKYSVLSILGLSFGCKDDPASPKSEPEPEPEPTKTDLIAIIAAPSKQRMPLDGAYTVNLNAGNSTPKEIITDYLWAKRKLPDAEFKEIGTGETISDNLNNTGSYEYRLTIKNSNEETSDEALHTFELFTPLQAIINGPQTIEYTNGNINIQLDASDSIGDIYEYTWIKKISWNEDKEIGNEASIVDEVDSIGIYYYTLKVKDTFGQSSIEHEVIVFNPNLSIQNSILFYQVSPIAPIILSKMDPASLQVEQILKDECQTISSRTLTSEPNGTRLVLVKDRDGLETYGKDLFLYDIKTGIFDRLHHTNGISWKAKWNPVNSWIAYVEDGRYPRNDKDEITLINANTKELIYLSGDKIDPNDKYNSMALSWNSGGDKLLAGSTRYNIPGSEKFVRRLSIYSDLFTGDPVRSQVHSEEYLSEYFGSESLEYNEGVSSVAWSPDGTIIAYNLTGGPYGMTSLGVYYLNAGVLVLAAADGSGIIKIFPDLLVQNINWSPNGQQLIFDVLDGESKHLYIMDKDGNNLRDLNNESGNSSFKFTNPVWS